MSKHYLSFIGSCCVFLAYIWTACAPEPKFRPPGLGELITIKPIAINKLAPQHLASKTRAIKLNVMWGGKAIDLEKGDMTLNFYGADSKIKYTHKWSDLVESYRQTGCNGEQVATMDGYLMGVALVCDGSIDMTNIQLIEGIDPKGEKRSATSWGSYLVSEDVQAVSIGLY